MVRTVVALCALLISAAVQAAPESLSKVDTSKGQILLEVQASGTAMRRISKVSTACTLQANGETKQKALAELKKKQTALTDAFAKVGLGATTLDFSAPATTNSGDYPMVLEVAEPAAEAVVDAAGNAVASEYQPVRSIFYSQRVGVSAPSATSMEMARVEMSEIGCDEDYRLTRRPDIEIADAVSGRTEATANAVKAARVQADNYAAALGLKVVGLIRVSETGMIKEFLGADAEYWLQELRNEMNRNRPLENDVPITANILVDFILAPK